MNLENILKEENKEYKKMDYADNIDLYKMSDEKKTIVSIVERNKEFTIDRDLFLSGQQRRLFFYIKGLK